MTSGRRTRVANLGAGRIGVWADYAYKDDLKSMPGARWDAHLHCWTMPSVFRAEAEELVGLRPSRRATTTSSLADAVALFLLTLPLELRRSAFRALVAVVHPDKGGTDAAARELLAGAKRAGVR